MKEKENFRIVYINLHGEVNIRAAYLHSFISQNNFDIKTIHFRRFVLSSRPPSEKELKTLKKVVDKLEPDIIMISLVSSDYWDAAKITKMFKEKVGPYGIIWGGVHATIDPYRCLEHVNVICRGEGEGAIIEYLNAMKKGKSIDKIKNLWVRKGEKIIENDFRPLIKNLDSLPLPDFSDKNKIYILGSNVYTKNPLPFRKYEYNTIFSRGCPFSCAYCVNSYYNKEFKNKYYRKRSVGNVMKELIEVKKKYPKLEAMNFWDDVFMTDVNWLREFAQAYKKYVNLPFFAYGHAALINEEKMRILKEANLDFFDIGIQSGCESLRRNIFKRIDSDEQIIRAARVMKKVGVPMGYDFILSEFETEEDLRKGLDFVFKLPKPFKPQVNRLAYYVNYDITKRALEEGKIKITDVASMDPKSRVLQYVPENELKKFMILYYYGLLGKKLIPNSLIKYMFENKFHEKHPIILSKFSGYVNKVEGLKYSVGSMLKMLRRREFGYIYNRIVNKKDYF